MGITIVDLLSPLFSLGAIVISIISLVKSNALTKGQVEMQIREMISTAKSRSADYAIKLSKDKNNAILKQALNAADEDVRNAYDEACAKYIDKKVDKERFKKNYMTEIRNIVENDETKKYYEMPQSKFKATIKVYDEWNNLEK